MMERLHSLGVTEVTRIAREAAREESPKLEVLGVTIGRGDGDYAEVIVDLDKSPDEPSRISVGVFRNMPEAAVHDEIVSRLRRHLREQGRHRPPSAGRT